MTSFSIARNNFKHNIKVYGLHLIAMIFSVAVYYNFISLKYNPQILKKKEVSKQMSGTANATAVILLVFLIFFIWYSSSFFLSQRKKEIGIYTFVGISNYKIAFIFAMEELFIGIVAIVVGLGAGVLFEKLFMMLLAKVALLDIKVEFFISISSLIETTITFLIIFVLSAIRGYYNIAKSSLIDLFNVLKKEEELPKINYIKAISSIVIIGLGYFIARISTKPNTNFGLYALDTIMLVVWGTYWLFGSFFSAIIRYLINKKKIFYDGVNIISISNIAFRIKRNYRTFATIAILIASTITAFGTVTSLRYYVTELHDVEVPYTFTYISDDINLIEKVNNTISNSNHNILLKEKINYLICNEGSCLIENRGQNQRNFIIAKLSDFKKITRDLNVKNAEKLIKNAQLNNNEAIYIEAPGVIMSIYYNLTNIKIQDLDFTFKANIKIPLFGKGICKPCIVVNDTAYKNLQTKLEQKQFNGIILDNQEQTEELVLKLYKLLPPDTGLFSYYVEHQMKYDLIGIVYFLGAFLSLVFVIATGSIIYFKVLSEALIDKNKYEILIKLGMTRAEVLRTISKQVGISFVLPLVIGSIHSCVAISVLSTMLKVNLIIPTLVSIITFATIYSIFYFLTTRKFLKIVC